MERVASIIPCNGAAMVPVKARFVTMPHSRGIAELSHEYLNSGWHTIDHRYRGLPKLLRTGITSEFDFATSDDIRQSQFYQDFLVPLDCPWFAGVLITAADEARCLTLQRSSRDGPFSHAELKILASLSRSLSATAALAQALNFARADAALASFDASNTGLALLNIRGEVSRLNQTATRLLGSDIQVSGRRLTSWSRPATAELDKAINTLFLGLAARGAMPPVPLPRMELKRRPVLAHVLRIPGITADVFGGARAVIVLSDLEQQTVPGEVALRSAFQLTAMEARIAQHIASGSTLDATADSLGIARETARTHLKAVFAKTDTHRQSELAILLSRFLGSDDGDP